MRQITWRGAVPFCGVVFCATGALILAGCGSVSQSSSTTPPAAPTLSYVTPNAVTEGALATDVVVTGSGFTAQAQAAWNGTSRATTVLSNSQIRVQLTTADLATAGSFSMVVSNGANAVSPPIPFVVRHRPSILSRVTVTTDGGEGDLRGCGIDQWTNELTCHSPGSLSGDGRYVAFTSRANLVSSGGFSGALLYLRDTCLGVSNAACTPTTKVVSLPLSVYAHLGLGTPFLSDNGRYAIVFGSYQSGVSGFLAFFSLFDICSGVPACSASGIGGGSGMSVASVGMTPDARFVAYSYFEEFNAGSAINDYCTGATGCKSSHTFLQWSWSSPIAISDNGRYVAGIPRSNLEVQDRCIGAPADCVPASVYSGTHRMWAMSGDARYILSPITVYTGANGLQASDGLQLFDTCIGAPSGCVPSSTLVTQAARIAGWSMSATARFVAFSSDQPNLVPGVATGVAQSYVADTCLGAPLGCVPSLMLVSQSGSGAPGNARSAGLQISRDGRLLSFWSQATNLVANDTNGVGDVFIARTGYPD